MPTTIRLSEPLPGVAVVTFARPEAANALSTLMGEELLLACDFAYAADTARFGLPEVASEIAAKAPLSVRALKHVVREAHSLDLAAA
ncbi:MAG TPA: hypothetical protein VHN73_05510, partial [Phenylobacterium sp.]|nr:hypothetical protein [Phenylobacterium sp.]